MQLAGTVALVTGASRGIGRALALALAGRGASVVLVARTAAPGGRLTGSLAETADAVAAAGGEALTVARDLNDADQVSDAAAAALGWKGHVDVLVNNAAFLGKAAFHSLDELSPVNWRRQLNVNVTAPLLLAQGLVPAMRAAGRGVIVNITSSAGDLYEGTVPGIAYGATKATLNRLTLALSRDLRAEGIAVFAVDPGYVRTDTSEQAADHPGWEIDPRRAHSPETAAETVVHLIERDAEEVSGRIWIARPNLPPTLGHDGRASHQTWCTSM
jgi:NAD(P)-dependent dehydrogenase (short-subunit alcohol dehydrogenase family)